MPHDLRAILVPDSMMTKLKKKVRVIWQNKLKAPKLCCEPAEEEPTEEEKKQEAKKLRQQRDKDFKEKLDKKFREIYSPPDSNRSGSNRDYPRLNSSSLNTSVFESGPGSSTPQSPYQKQFFPKNSQVIKNYNKFRKIKLNFSWKVLWKKAIL